MSNTIITPRPPMVPRPPSAREHHTLVQQVRSSLAEARESAPIGVNPEEIKQRQKLLEKVLKDLEREGQRDNSLRQKHVEETRLEAERLENERISKSVEESNMRQVTHFIAHTLLKKDTADAKALQNKAHDEKAFHCKLQHEEMRKDQLNALLAADEERNIKLALLEERRLSTLQQKQQRCRSLALKAEEKRLHMLEEEERAYSEKLSAANELRKLREERAESARLRKQEQQLEKNVIQTKRRFQGPGTKTAVFFSGKGTAPTLCTTVRDHEERMRRMVKAEAREKQLYEADQELRDFLKGALKQRAETRVKRAESNYDRILSEKLEKYERMKEAAEQKQRHILEQKRADQSRIRSAGIRRAHSIRIHQNAAAEHTLQKAEKVAQDNLYRWNQRSATVVEDILEKYDRMQSAKVLQKEYVAEDDEASDSGVE